MIGESVVKTSSSGTRLILIEVAPGDDQRRRPGWRVRSSSSSSSGRGLVGLRLVVAARVAGERQEHLVQRRAAQPDVLQHDAPRRRAGAAPRRAPPRPRSRGRRATGSPCRPWARRRPGRPAPSTAGPSDAASATVSSIRSPPIWDFSSLAVPARDDAAVVDHDDLVGEPVGLLEVLRREQQRRAAGHERGDHLPHVQAGLGVEPGRRLVEEDDLGVGHERAGEVEAAPHAARVGLRRPVRGVGEPELLEQLPGPLPAAPPSQVVEPARPSRGSRSR